MRFRLALLLAASITFAPAWNGQGHRLSTRGDLAARMLAPTFDEGTLREAPPEVKHQIGGRHPKRFRSDIALGGLPAGAPDTIGLALLWSVLICRITLTRRIDVSTTLPRAPP